MKIRWGSPVKAVWLLFLLLALSVPMLAANQARAAGTIVVNSTLDSIANDGVCTLREAVIAANRDRASGSRRGECAAGQGDDVIILEARLYTLTRSSSGSEDSSTTGDLDLFSNIHIQGPENGLAQIAAVNLNDRPIHILSGNVTLSNLSLRGGAISASGGSHGGGVANFGNLTLRNTYIYENTAVGSGGGIYNAPGASLTIQSSTLAANQALGSGGGLANLGSASLTNTTLSGNTSQVAGGGILSEGSTTLDSVTVTLNQAGSTGNGGGVSISTGATQIKNSLFAGNISLAASPHPDCSGTVQSFGYNLFQSALGCTLEGELAGNLTGVDALLAPTLADNGGLTPTHALQTGSPAVEAGSCSTTGGLSLDEDQRGVARPQGSACDIGAFEAPDPPQVGPLFTVNTVTDSASTVCTTTECTLRAAILAANARPNGSEPDRLNFNLSGSGLVTIDLTAPLPAVSEALHIDGFSQPGASRNTLEQGSNAILLVALNGEGAGAGAHGLTITSPGSTVEGLVIQDFSGDGVRISGSGNRIAENKIFNNAGAGVRVEDGSGNTISANSIYANASGGISLAPGANSDQPAPGLSVAVTRIADASPSTDAGGSLSGIPGSVYQVEVFGSPACSGAQGQTFLGSIQVTTSASGQASFVGNFSPAVPIGAGLTATVTGPDGSTSVFSSCSVVQALNDSWLTAQSLSASTSQAVYQDGQSRWFKFPVTPGGKLTLTVSGLPGSLVTLHRDLLQTYFQLEAVENPAALAASDLPGGYLPGGYLPGGYLPGGYLPGGYLPGGYLPGGYLPGGYLPGGYLPGGYLPGGYLPGGYLPGGYLPGGYLPADYLPGGYLPGGYLPELYSGAIRRTLIAISLDFGGGSHQIERNTWDLNEELYVQVTGPASLGSPFTLSVVQESGICTDVPSLPAPVSNSEVITGPLPTNAGLRTLILWDSARMAASSPQSDLDFLRTRLDQFAARPEIRAAVIDLASPSYPRVAQANQIADQNLSCISSKNAVADEIKRVIDLYRAANSANGATTLEYIVLVGSDHEIPFRRYPDQAGLANENEYIPPVAFQSASEASLRSGQVLGQDAYGSRFEVTRSGYTFPVPDLAVGRLVRTAEQVVGMLDAYIASNGEMVPQSALVTGYDFVADAASAIKTEFESGLAPGSPLSFLYQPQDAGLAGAWTASDLRENLLPASGEARDMIFFAGHFSAGGVLAADYETSLYTTEIAAAGVDFSSSLVLALGCHSGYNIPGPDALPFSPIPDWPEAMAIQQATFIAATGYAYGDTELTEYGERLFLELVRRLRTGSGAVDIGQALVDSKLAYMSQTVSPEGIDDKTLHATILYGLPMMKVNMPGQRLSGGQPSIVAGASPVSGGPGASLGLQIGQPASGGGSSLVRITPSLTRYDVPLTNIFDNSPVTATYFTGSTGDVVARPAEPVLPLEQLNVSAPGLILRGAGFRGGRYTDLAGITPLTSAATTENSRSHPAFFSDSFYPVQNWGANYIDLLSGGSERLLVTPAQYRSSSLESTQGTLCLSQQMDFRLYYLDQNWAGSSDALLRAAAVAASPDISEISMEELAPGTVRFQARVYSDPAAGVQDVWVTYTSTSGAWYGSWLSLDLSPDAADPTLWAGDLALPGGVSTSQIRFIVQAANGAGAVSLVDPELRIQGGAPTQLEFASPPPSQAPYDTPLDIQVRLTSAGSPIAGKLVQVSLSGVARAALTDSSGVARVSLPALAVPGPHRLQASFVGAPGFQASTLSRDIQITRQPTHITLDPVDATGLSSQAGLVTATLLDGRDQPVREKTLIFVLRQAGQTVHIQPAITNYLGQAALGTVPLPPGSYSLTVFYGIFLDENGDQADLAYDTYEPSQASGTLTLLNSAPTAVDDQAVTPEDTPVTIPVLENDSDPDGDTLSVVSLGTPAHGTATTDGVTVTYTPEPFYNGEDSFTYTISDGTATASAVVRIVITPVNNNPVCSQAAPSIGDWIWPPNNNVFYDVQIVGVTDVDGDAVTITIDAVYQDESVSLGGFIPDARGIGTSTASLRAERDGMLNGRVYHIYFTARDGNGGSCSIDLASGPGVRVGVSGNQGAGIDPIDEGPLFDSTVAD